MKRHLNEILDWLEQPPLEQDREVTGLCLDSRRLRAGDVFLALSGHQIHGYDFAYQAQRAGAVAILTEKTKSGRATPKSRREPLDIPVITLDDLSARLGHLAARFYDDPSAHLAVTAITGTNGKTSVAWLLLQAWQALGHPAAYIGTLGQGDSSGLLPLKNTTPSALEMQALLAQFLQQGKQRVSVEVSSHALSQGRDKGLRLQNAVFTNLSRDHLDYHNTMAEYQQAKARLFGHPELQNAIINQADPAGRQIAAQLADTVRHWPYAARGHGKDLPAGKAAVLAENIRLHPAGLDFTLCLVDEQGGVCQQAPIRTGLFGHFNVDNLLAVAAVLLAEGESFADIAAILPALKPVPGRMNLVPTSGPGPLIVVDYAHTPDALEQVLKALKQHNARKIWCVFGCGGNRDKGKRPQMGHIAEQLADEVILTDDNPRFEDGNAIIDDIKFGMLSQPRVIRNRQKAIEYVISTASPSDLILIAGKGHEAWQEVQGEYLPFDDCRIAQTVLEQCA
jgi:UDP-N-acetylmuramoyl-L-alanyl-D-glutamate--2,6-diaminopimelate ligase